MVNNSARAMMGAVRRWYDQVLDGSLVLPYVSATGGGMTGGLTVNSAAGISTIGGITASGMIQGGSLSSLGAVSASGTVTAGNLGTTGNLTVQGGATITGSVTTGALQANSLYVPNVATVGALQSNNDISANGTVTGSIVASTGAINAAGAVNAAQYNIAGLTLMTSVGSATSIFDGSGSPNIVLDSGGNNFYRAVSHSVMNRPATVSYAIFNAVGTYNASGSWLVISDEAAKTDVVAPYSRGLSAIQALRPVSFKYAAGPFAGDETRYGLIAQDMQTVVPEMVAEVDFDGERFLGLQPGMLIWVLVNSCQELAARVEALEGTAAA
jgi:cytoskeletal protein CcmA (bactofilin family)